MSNTSPSYRPTRLRGVVATVAAVMVVTFAVDALIAAVCGEPRGRILTPIAPELIDLFGGRVARFEQMKQAGQLDESRLVAVLGMSTAAVGLNPQTLIDFDPLHRNWLVLGARGGTFVQLEFYGRPLLHSALSPAVVVLAIHQTMLSRGDNPIAEPVSVSNVPRHLFHLQLLHALSDSSWIYRNRGYAMGAGNMLRYNAAHAVRSAFDLPTSVQFAPEAQPYSMWPQDWMDPATLHPDPTGLVFQRQVYNGTFKIERFMGFDHQIVALHQLIAEWRGRGARVVLLLMPESSELRGRYPLFVGERFDEAIAGQPVTVVDERKAMADDQYYDLVHLNRLGCEALSRMVPGLIQ